MMEQIKQALGVYVSQTGTVNTLWNLFLVVGLAMLGYVYKDRTLTDEWEIKVGLTIGFAVFAFGNSAAILRSQRILVTAADYLNKVSVVGDDSFNQLLESHKAVSVDSIRRTHILFTLLILMAMWLPNIANALPLKRNKAETQSRHNNGSPYTASLHTPIGFSPWILSTKFDLSDWNLALLEPRKAPSRKCCRKKDS